MMRDTIVAAALASKTPGAVADPVPDLAAPQVPANHHKTRARTGLETAAPVKEKWTIRSIINVNKFAFSRLPTSHILSMLTMFLWHCLLFNLTYTLCKLGATNQPKHHSTSEAGKREKSAEPSN